MYSGEDGHVEGIVSHLLVSAIIPMGGRRCAWTVKEVSRVMWPMMTYWTTVENPRSNPFTISIEDAPQS